MEFQGHGQGGDNAFWIFRGQGGVKCGSCLWYGMDIFCNRPFSYVRSMISEEKMEGL